MDDNRRLLEEIQPLSALPVIRHTGISLRGLQVGIADMGAGVKIEAVKIDETGITFTKKKPPAQPDRSLWFRIGEICVDESKGFISSGRAVEKIRELLREERREDGKD